MAETIKVLVIEDEPDDARIMAMELERAGFALDLVRVEMEAEYLAELAKRPDIILSDYTLPRFSAERALQLLHERGYDIPFLIVTGSVSEEVAVRCMHEGAADYILKHHADRLGQAVRRALARQQNQRNQRLADQALLELASGLGHARGTAFLHSLVQTLTSAVRMDCALLGELSEDGESLVTLSLLDRGQRLPNFTRRLPGTPCLEAIAQRDVVVLAHGVLDTYPQDELLQEMAAESYLGVPLMDRAGRCRGFLAAIGRTPLAEPEIAAAVVRVFAERAASELERTRAEEALRHSERRYRRFFEQDLTGDYISSVDGRLIDCNPAFLRIFGFESREQALATPTWRLYPRHEDRHLLFQRLRENGSLQHVELTMCRLDGSEIFVTENVIGDFDEDGELIGIRGYLIDDTERRRGEDRIRQQAALLDQATDAITVFDGSGATRFWNRAAAELYQWSREEALGRSAQELMAPDEEAWDTARRTTLADGEWQGELHLHRRDGTALIVLGRWSLVGSSPAEGPAILALHTDITERKKQDAQRIHAQRLESIGRLAGGLAHDLNNVLAPILMSIDLLRQAIEVKELQEILTSLEASAERGAHMIQQILWFARGVEGRRTRVDLHQLVGEMARIVRETFPRDITLDIDLPEDLGHVLGDSTQLYQVLMNLALNARDAMPGGGRLEIRGTPRELDESYCRMHGEAEVGRYLVLTIRDTGVGVSEEDLPRLFEPFFTTKERGNGLGLATVHSIVKSHGGFIEASSPDDRGTLFTLFLPAAEGDKPAAAEPAASWTPRGRGETILIVDDELAIRTITAETLQMNGYRVLTACDGAEAMALLARNKGKVAGVLADRIMPEIDGIALVRALRRLDPALTLIASSGHPETRRRFAAPEEEPDAFLDNPFTAETLLRTLSRLLDTPTIH